MGVKKKKKYAHSSGHKQCRRSSVLCCKLACEWTIRALTSTTVTLRSVTRQLQRFSRACRSSQVRGRALTSQFGVGDHWAAAAVCVSEGVARVCEGILPAREWSLLKVLRAMMICALAKEWKQVCDLLFLLMDGLLDRNGFKTTKLSKYWFSFALKNTFFSLHVNDEFL